MTPTDFDNWFAKPLAALNADSHGGFAVLMVALPLTERYLREKSGCHEGNLDDRFYTAFIQVFPGLTIDQAKKFWHSYRNGLLHQATFSKQSRSGTIMPKAWISSKLSVTPGIINYDQPSDSFVLLPKEFSERIVAVIQGDFSTFLGASSVNHPPPQIQYPPSWPASVKTKGSPNQGPPPSGVP